MTRQLRKKIFAGCERDSFIGRTAEFERILTHAQTGGSALTLLAAPSAGASELLRQIYDRLFVEQTDVIPFYFEFKPTDEDAHAAALRFLREFLLQTVAFRRRDTGIIDASPEICEIAELAVPSDGYWIDRLIESCHSDSRLNNANSVIKNCLSAPLRAAANGATSVVMIDALDFALQLAGGDALFDEIRDIATKANIPFVLAGKRRSLHGSLFFDSLHIDKLSFDNAIKLVEHLAAKFGVAINDQTRDLIVVQTGGVAGYIVSLIKSAAERSRDFKSFDRVEQIYTYEILGGRIGNRLEARFDLISQNATERNLVLRLISETLAADGGAVATDYWKKKFGKSDESFNTILTSLHCEEFVNLISGRVEIAADRVIRDYINARTLMEIGRQPRALAVGEVLAANIREAPKLMSRFYRGNASLGLRKVLQALDGQKVATFLIDYGDFKSGYKGETDEKIMAAAKTSDEKIALPKIVYTTNASAVYPRLNEFCDAERACVAIGMSEDENIALLAVEIDSKLEATAETANFWCDRIEMVAADCSFENYRLWLIATEGFDEDALRLLEERNAHGSSRKQIKLLAKTLGSEIGSNDEQRSNEYKITLPMGEDTELIAAHTIEEVSRRHNIPQKTINQIKTALVEAYINATEHSLSPDRKIHLSIRFDENKITITISNRGVRLADTSSQTTLPASPRRGWGLKLMRELMDKVIIEETDDGTRITLVKLIHRTEN